MYLFCGCLIYMENSKGKSHPICPCVCLCQTCLLLSGKFVGERHTHIQGHMISPPLPTHPLFPVKSNTPIFLALTRKAFHTPWKTFPLSPTQVSSPQNGAFWNLHPPPVWGMFNPHCWGACAVTRQKQSIVFMHPFGLKWIWNETNWQRFGTF